MSHNGIRFARAAKEAGAVAVLTDAAGASRAVSEGLGLPVVVVDDPRSHVAALAAAVYGHPARDLVTLAVTGTNGKTTTSYLMRAALAAVHPRAALCGTVETRVGPVSFEAERTTAESPVVQRFLALARECGEGAAVI